MCNRFADPVCAAHEPALRADAAAAEQRVKDLTERLAEIVRDLRTSEEADPGILERFRVGHLADLSATRDQVAAERTEAITQWRTLQLRHDQTTAGLSELEKALDRSDLSPQRRNRLRARYRLATMRREAAIARWKGSSAWAEERLRAATQGTALFEKYLQLLIQRRAAEHHVEWPPPAGSGRSAWDRTAAAETLQALEDTGAAHPQVTFMVPAVIDCRYKQPTRPGWNPLLAAHYASLPTPLLPRDLTCQLHVAAHTEKPVTVTTLQLVATVRADGDLVVDDEAAAPVHDVTAGERWATVQVVGPLQLVDQEGGPIGELHTTGWVLVREQDSRLLITHEPLPDMVTTRTNTT